MQNKFDAVDINECVGYGNNNTHDSLLRQKTVVCSMKSTLNKPLFEVLDTIRRVNIHVAYILTNKLDRSIDNWLKK